MAFPTTSLANNQVHKEGNRAWVYDSTSGVWNQVAGNDTDSSNLSGTLGNAITIGSGVTFPTGHVVSQFYVETSASATITINGAWHSATNQTITISAADMDKISSVVILWNFQSLVYRGGSHHFANVRLARTAPGNLTAIGKHLQTGTNGTGHAVASPIYDNGSLCVRSTKVSSADHTFVLQAMGETQYTSEFNPVQTGANVTVWGFK